MANIVVDEDHLIKLLTILQTSFIVLDHLEANNVDLWEGYSLAMLEATEELNECLKRRVANNIHTITQVQAPVEETTEQAYLIVRMLNSHNHFYSYASTRKEARHYVNEFADSDKYYWKVVKIPKV